MNLFDNIFNKRARKKALERFAASLDALGYSYEMLETSPVAGEAVGFYKNELEKGRSEGYFPVIVVDEPQIFDLIGRIKNEGFDIAAALCSELNEAGPVFDRRLEQGKLLPEELEWDDPAERERFTQQGFIVEEAAECFTALDEFSLIFTEFTRSLRTSALVKLPTDKPWEAALYLPFGGWNDCPAPLEMAAMLKKWYESFGAVPAVFSGDALEIFLQRSIEEERAAEAAREILAFGAISHPPLDESAKGFSELAQSLCSKRIWHFWWD